MIRIIDSEVGPVTWTDPETGKERTDDLVRRVAFVDHIGALRELQFHPPGTDVAGEAEIRPRVVGEFVHDDGTTMQHYAFTDPEEAVAAYEAGKVV